MTKTAAEQLPRGTSWALGSGTVLQGLNSAILAVALVSIGADLGTGPATAWIVSALYLSAAVCSPTGGRLADLFGPRRVYLVGLAITLGASVAGPFVPSLEWLVADRFLLGVGTALQFPTAMAIIRREAQRLHASPASALGVIALCGQTTAALGPALGGPIVALWGWEGIFWVNVPMVVNSAFWVLRKVPTDPPRTHVGFAGTVRAVDPVGLAAFVATLATLMLGLLSLESGAQWWWFVAAAVGVVTLVLWSARSAQPFLDVRLLTSNPLLWRTCLRAMITFVSFYTIFYGLPQWFEASRGLGPVHAGLLMVPVFGVGMVSTLVATRFGARLGPRVLLVVGGVAMAVAGALALWVVTVDSPVWLYVVLGGLLGLPNGFNNIGNQLQLHSSVDQQSTGVASGLYRTFQYVGAALAAVVVAAGVTPAGDAGIHVLGAWVAGIGLLLVLLSGAALLASRRSTAR